MSKNVRGFSFAEVLLVISIVGVLSVVTIPAVIKNIQNAQNLSKWKRVYSAIAAVYNKKVFENAGTAKGFCDIASNYTRYNCYRDIFTDELSVVKKCDTGTEVDICWHKGDEWYNKLGVPENSTAKSAAVLSDGTLLQFTFPIQGVTCSYNYGYCGVIFVDVNGFKPPNTRGIDVFRIELQEKVAKPQGWNSGDGGYDSCINGNGGGCSAYYLKN